LCSWETKKPIDFDPTGRSRDFVKFHSIDRSEGQCKYTATTKFTSQEILRESKKNNGGKHLNVKKFLNANETELGHLELRVKLSTNITSIIRGEARKQIFCWRVVCWQTDLLLANSDMSSMSTFSEPFMLYPKAVSDLGLGETQEAHEVEEAHEEPLPGDEFLERSNESASGFKHISVQNKPNTRGSRFRVAGIPGYGKVFTFPLQAARARHNYLNYLESLTKVQMGSIIAGMCAMNCQRLQMCLKLHRNHCKEVTNQVKVVSKRKVFDQPRPPRPKNKSTPKGKRGTSQRNVDIVSDRVQDEITSLRPSKKRRGGCGGLTQEEEQQQQEEEEEEGEAEEEEGEGEQEQEDLPGDGLLQRSNSNAYAGFLGVTLCVQEQGHKKWCATGITALFSTPVAAARARRDYLDTAAVEEVVAVAVEELMEQEAGHKEENVVEEEGDKHPTDGLKTTREGKEHQPAVVELESSARMLAGFEQKVHANKASGLTYKHRLDGMSVAPGQTFRDHTGDVLYKSLSGETPQEIAAKLKTRIEDFIQVNREWYLPDLTIDERLAVCTLLLVPMGNRLSFPVGIEGLLASP